MEASKVRVEIVEAVGDGTFNAYAHESGSLGKSKPGVDLCYALDCCPRPLLVLAMAILTMNERHRLKGLPGITASNHHGAVELYCPDCFSQHGWPDWEDDMEEDEKYPPDLKLANCARCSRLLAAPDQSGIPDHL